MPISKFAEGHRIFKSLYFEKHKEEFVRLAKSGQKPQTLLIACSDSRVMPSVMVQAKPGELFVVRNIGNFVPPYKPDEEYHGTAAAIEYAVGVLKVSEIILSGHSHCGAIKSLFMPINDSRLVHTKKWLELGEKAKKRAILTLDPQADMEEKLRTTEKINVIAQLENLLTYPVVKEKIERKELSLHGWLFSIETGEIEYFDQSRGRFYPLDEITKI